MEKLKDYLLEKYVNEDGDLDISGLDFSDFDGNVSIGEMKVKRHLVQNNQKVEGSLHQDFQEVGGILFQDSQKVKGNLWQDRQKVKGVLRQDAKNELKKGK